MYIEYLFVIADYFGTVNKKVFVYEWVVPFVIGFVSGLFTFFAVGIDLYDFISNSIGFVATLLGFTLAALTLFLTSNSQLEKIKMIQTDKMIRGKNISLYRLLVINYSYLIIVESILCICFYMGSLFSFVCPYWLAVILNSIFIVMVFNILLMTIRSITDLYFIIAKE